MKLIKKLAIATALIASTSTAATGDTGKLEAGATVCWSHAGLLVYAEALNSNDPYRLNAIYVTDECRKIPEGAFVHYRVLTSDLSGGSVIVGGSSKDELSLVVFVTNESIGVK